MLPAPTDHASVFCLGLPSPRTDLPGPQSPRTSTTAHNEHQSVPSTTTRDLGPANARLVSAHSRAAVVTFGRATRCALLRISEAAATASVASQSPVGPCRARQRRRGRRLHRRCPSASRPLCMACDSPASSGGKPASLCMGSARQMTRFEQAGLGEKIVYQVAAVVDHGEDVCAVCQALSV